MNKILAFFLFLSAAFPAVCFSAPAPEAGKVQGPLSLSLTLSLVRADKILLEKAVESGKYGRLSSSDAVKIYRDLELAESCLSALRPSFSEKKILSQMREASEQLKKSKVSAARLNDIIKSGTRKGLYQALASMESDLGEIVAYLNGLRLVTRGK